MITQTRPRRVLVMGVGNSLLQDDGIGIHVTEALRTSCPHRPGIEFIDGGTIGLSLLPTIEDADAVIVIDASELGQSPGTLGVFLDQEIDRLLSGKRRSVHEVALADLFAAATIRGHSPARRALVGIQPACTDWGLEPTHRVRAAIPEACRVVTALLQEFQCEVRDVA